MRQKFMPQFKKGAFLDLRHFFLICGVFLELRQNLFSVFSTPPICGGNRRECGGNRRECGGNSRKANSVAAFLFYRQDMDRWFLVHVSICQGKPCWGYLNLAPQLLVIFWEWQIPIFATFPDPQTTHEKKGFTKQTTRKFEGPGSLLSQKSPKLVHIHRFRIGK